MTYEIWSGYLSDHTFEDDEYTDEYEVARSVVLDALEEEARHADREGEADPDEWSRWAEYTLLYESAAYVLEHTPRGEPFDVTIRDERFAIVEA